MSAVQSSDVLGAVYCVVGATYFITSADSNNLQINAIVMSYFGTMKPAGDLTSRGMAVAEPRCKHFGG